MTVIEGGCLCGAVRYSADAEPLLVRACWCRVCQYFSCGNASVNLAFPSDRVTITGALQDFQSNADSGNRMHRQFCPVCGVQVTSASEARPHLLIVRAGTLDNPEIAKPQGVIWTASAPGWAHIDPELPQFEGQAMPPGLALK